MFPLTYGAIYQTPSDYQPPEETDLTADTEYPNLNSRDYAKRPANRTLRMHSAWECVNINESGHIAIATNKMSGRECMGSLWGFENADAVTPEAACYKLQCSALIAKLQFISRNILVLALHNGKVQLWSTHSEVRSAQNPYCLFLIGEKCEHAKPIVCLDVMKANSNRAVTGSKDGTLKLWDMGSADLFSIRTFRFAHTDVITGVSSSTKDKSILASCSLDKSALLWDVRLTRPAIAIYEHHNVRFKDITWDSFADNDHLLYLGDESGVVHRVDNRMPNLFLKSKRYYDRPIRKVLPNGPKLAVLADSNSVKIATITAENEDAVIYENCEAQHFMRDGVWRNANEFLTVGYEGKMRIHKME